MHEVSAPYHPESNGMAERLICSLKDRLVHVNKDQGFNLQQNLNIAVSSYWIVPHCATGLSPFVLLYGCEESCHMESYLQGICLKNSIKMPLVLTLKFV